MIIKMSQLGDNSFLLTKALLFGYKCFIIVPDSLIHIDLMRFFFH